MSKLSKSRDEIRIHLGTFWTFWNSLRGEIIFHGDAKIHGRLFPLEKCSRKNLDEFVFRS